MAAAGGGQQLVDLLTQMRSTINEHFIPTLEKLRGDFEHEMKAVADWTDEVTTAIDHTSQTCTSEVNKAMDAIHHGQQDVKTDSAHCSETIHGHSSTVQEANTNAHTAAETSTGHLADVTSKLGEAEEAHGHATEEIKSHSDSWQSDIDHKSSEVNAHAHTIDSHFSQAGEQVLHNMNDLGSQLNHTSETLTSHVSTTLESHDSALQQLVSEQGQNFIHGIGGELGGHAGDFMSTIGQFMEAGEKLGETFGGGTQEVLDDIQKVTQIIDTIKPILDFIQKFD